MSKEYPVEIYPKPNERIKDSAERIYDLGFRDGRFKERLEASNPLAGWSNLTEAIKTGERIDWDALDGIEAKCVHPELGTLTYKLERDGNFPPAKYSAWYKVDCPSIWLEALIKSWLGLGGWSLWVKGDLPLRKLTADQLAPGTGFYGTHPESGEKLKGMVVVPGFGSYKAAIFTKPVPFAPASEVEVIEVYGVGTFCKPKGDIPLAKQTADDLEPGTIFEAVLPDEKEFGPATLLRVDAGIIDVGDWQMLDVDLTCIEVSRVLGTFQNPKENQ